MNNLNQMKKYLKECIDTISIQQLYNLCLVLEENNELSAEKYNIDTSNLYPCDKCEKENNGCLHINSDNNICFTMFEKYCKK